MNYLIAGIFVVLIVCQQYVQKRHDSSYSHRQFSVQDFKYLPNNKFLRGAALSYNEMLADMIWIKAIGYFGHQDRQNTGDYQWLYQLLKATTTLDPYFDDPYEFGGIVLGNIAGDIDGSFEILEKGMNNVPKHHERYWYLPFFTAFNYMYHKDDYQKAAQYLEIAASFPQRPDYLPLLVARLYANTHDPSVAIPFLKRMIERAPTPEMVQKLDLRIKEIQVKVDINNINKVVESYKSMTGNYPVSLDELVNNGVISSIPKDPFGGSYFLDEETHEVLTTTKVDSMQLHIKRNRESKVIIDK
ncbi:MAG: hypothetical protein MI892_02045 [Desulfobacterales bacterium]|nr:hypothetical protein [Desulfobacterales bacterium]